MGYFFGFKLPLIINDIGEILNFVITPGNADDRESLKNNSFLGKVFGELFTDKGYLPESRSSLPDKGIFQKFWEVKSVNKKYSIIPCGNIKSKKFLSAANLICFFFQKKLLSDSITFPPDPFLALIFTIKNA